MSEPDLHNQQPEREETAEKRRLRYMTEEERREWSGLAEWRDPLDKEKPEEEPQTAMLAIGSLICGIVAILTACNALAGGLFGIAAIVLGIVSKIREKPGTVSTIGIVLGVCGIGVSLLALMIKIALRLAGLAVTNTLPGIPD